MGKKNKVKVFKKIFWTKLNDFKFIDKETYFDAFGVFI